MGSELWAPMLKVVYNTVLKGFIGIPNLGAMLGTIGSASDHPSAVNTQDTRAIAISGTSIRFPTARHL